MNKFLSTVAATVLLVTGCGGPPHINALHESSVVLAFGDSITFGSGAEQTESYPSLLAGRIGCRVINAGMPGEITSEGLQRLPAVLEEAKPDLVILCHGGNDMLRKKDESAITKNLNAMISLIKEAGTDVVLIGVPKPGLWLRPAPFYKKTAAEHDIPFDGKTLPKILSTPALKSDQIHPNAAGYRSLAEAIAQLIRESQTP
ncbi:MAG: arylesterase [Verrucomicrobia bacterium]|nr:arylesterase [Verrucomicrobiota bacterium]